jgi:hypothetical protein
MCMGEMEPNMHIKNKQISGGPESCQILMTYLATGMKVSSTPVDSRLRSTTEAKRLFMRRSALKKWFFNDPHL